MLPVANGTATAWSREAMKKTSRHRITPPGTRTTHDDGRSPGSQVGIVHLTFPARCQWCWGRWRLAVYSCGGSHGFGLGLTVFPFHPQGGTASWR